MSELLGMILVIPPGIFLHKTIRKAFEGGIMLDIDARSTDHISRDARLVNNRIAEGDIQSENRVFRR